MSSSEHENFLEFSLRTPDGLIPYNIKDFANLKEIANKLTAEEKHEYLLESVEINGRKMTNPNVRTFQNLFDYVYDKNIETHVLKQFSDIMGHDPSQELENALKYIAGMQTQLGAMAEELREVKVQLTEMQKSQPETVNDRLINNFTYFHNNINKVTEQLSAAKYSLIDTAANAVLAFKEKGRAGVNDILQKGIISAKSILGKCQHQMLELLPKIGRTIYKINSIGNELSKIGNSVANVERILSGRSTQEISGESQGAGITRALNVPLKKSYNILRKYIEGIDTIYNKLSKVSAELNSRADERSSVLGKLQEAKENVATKSGDGSVNKEVNREVAAR